MQVESKSSVPSPARGVAPAGRRRLPVPPWVAQLVSDRKAAAGLALLVFFILLVIVGPIIWNGNPMTMDFTLSKALNPPSAKHWFGTDQLNRDMFLQVINGGRQTLFIGFAVGVIATILSVGIGVTAGYFGGWIDEILSMIMNVFLVIPLLPLCIVIAAWVQAKSALPIIFVIAFVSWAWSARVYRSQAMSIRSKDFVLAAVVSGESGLRIVWREILPNMISIVVGGFIGVTSYAILFSVALQFLGFANNAAVSWGEILYWAQNSSAVEIGAWWTYMFAGSAVTLVVVALYLINFGVDAISNPRLRVEKVHAKHTRQPAPRGAEAAATR